MEGQHLLSIWKNVFPPANLQIHVRSISSNVDAGASKSVRAARRQSSVGGADDNDSLHGGDGGVLMCHHRSTRPPPALDHPKKRPSRPSVPLHPHRRPAPLSATPPSPPPTPPSPHQPHSFPARPHCCLPSLTLRLAYVLCLVLSTTPLSRRPPRIATSPGLRFRRLGDHPRATTNIRCPRTVWRSPRRLHSRLFALGAT
nr:hypothetical protein CFP56_02751 [Quercus suber]